MSTNAQILNQMKGLPRTHELFEKYPIYKLVCVYDSKSKDVENITDLSALNKLQDLGDFYMSEHKRCSKEYIELQKELTKYSLSSKEESTNTTLDNEEFTELTEKINNLKLKSNYFLQLYNKIRKVPKLLSVQKGAVNGDEKSVNMVKNMKLSIKFRNTVKTILKDKTDTEFISHIKFNTVQDIVDHLHSIGVENIEHELSVMKEVISHEIKEIVSFLENNNDDQLLEVTTLEDGTSLYDVLTTEGSRIFEINQAIRTIKSKLPKLNENTEQEDLKDAVNINQEFIDRLDNITKYTSMLIKCGMDNEETVKQIMSMNIDENYKKIALITKDLMDTTKFFKATGVMVQVQEGKVVNQEEVDKALYIYMISGFILHGIQPFFIVHNTIVNI